MSIKTLVKPAWQSIEAQIRPTRRSIRSLIDLARRRQTPARTSHPLALNCVVASNEFGSYCVPLSSIHRPAAQAILRGKVWERETIKFMRENCGQGDIVHAGTYFGDFLPGLARAIVADALIWAFEPNEENYRCASITIELNALGPMVKLTHAALGPTDGVVMLSVSDDSGCSLGGSSHVSIVGKERATQVSLDRFIPSDRRISVLQLDVEGYEDSALRGAEHLITRDRPILILETIPTSEWFKELLRGSGYIQKANLADNSVFVPA